MELQEYIASGILESYALGLASPEEMRDVEAMAERHAVVKEEIAAIQAALGLYVTQFAQSPAPGLKLKVMAALDELAQEEATQGAAVAQTLGAGPFVSVSRPTAGSVSDAVIPVGGAGRRQAWGPWAVAAGILLGLSLLGNFYYYRLWKQTDARLADAVSERQLLTQQRRDMEVRLSNMTAVVGDPDYRVVDLKAANPALDAEVLLYWHPQAGHLYIAASRLPPLPKGKKYQLWAIVGKKPMDAGLFAPSGQKGLVAMKTMPQAAQAFAITLEDEAGSPVPTSDIYVLGNT